MVLHIARQLQIVCLNWISNKDKTLFPCFFLGLWVGKLAPLNLIFLSEQQSSIRYLEYSSYCHHCCFQNELNLKNVDWIATTLHALC